MLKSYLLAALHQAQYQLEADGSIRGSIPGCPGVWARTGTLEQCRSALETLLEQWVLQRVWAHEPLPEFEGRQLQFHAPAAQAASPATPAFPTAAPSTQSLGPEEETAAVMAIVSMMMDCQRHRIVSVRPIESAWSREGRRQIHASHRLR